MLACTLSYLKGAGSSQFTLMKLLQIARKVLLAGYFLILLTCGWYINPENNAVGGSWLLFYLDVRDRWMAMFWVSLFWWVATGVIFLIKRRGSIQVRYPN
jgi:hypothetical protein